MLNDPIPDLAHRGVTPTEYAAMFGTALRYAVVAPSGYVAVTATGQRATYRNENRARHAARTLEGARIVDLDPGQDVVCA